MYVQKGIEPEVTVIRHHQIRQSLCSLLLSPLAVDDFQFSLELQFTLVCLVDLAAKLWNEADRTFDE